MYGNKLCKPLKIIIMFQWEGEIFDKENSGKLVLFPQTYVGSFQDLFASLLKT